MNQHYDYIINRLCCHDTAYNSIYRHSAYVTIMVRFIGPHITWISHWVSPLWSWSRSWCCKWSRCKDICTSGWSVDQLPPVEVGFTAPRCAHMRPDASSNREINSSTSNLASTIRISWRYDLWLTTRQNQLVHEQTNQGRLRICRRNYLWKPWM